MAYTAYIAPSPAAAAISRVVKRRAIGGLGGQARQAEERQRGHHRPQREHAKQRGRAVMRGPSPWNAALGVVAAGTVVAHLAVGHRGPRRHNSWSAPPRSCPKSCSVAAQADQGQEELQDQDRYPQRGTDREHGGHGDLLAAGLRTPRRSFACRLGFLAYARRSGG